MVQKRKKKTDDMIEITNATFHNTSAGRAVFSKKFNFISFSFNSYLFLFTRITKCNKIFNTSLLNINFYIYIKLILFKYF